jgi:hypothetical protein
MATVICDHMDGLFFQHFLGGNCFCDLFEDERKPVIKEQTSGEGQEPNPGERTGKILV